MGIGSSSAAGAGRGHRPGLRPSGSADRDADASASRGFTDNRGADDYQATGFANHCPDSGHADHRASG